MDVVLSDYAKCLPFDSRKRYVEKISKIDLIDPYLLTKDELQNDKCLYPKISYPDIVNYLLFAPSPYTKDELKAYKSLDAYNQFISGWVKEVATKQFGHLCLVYGRVINSKCCIYMYGY